MSKASATAAHGSSLRSAPPWSGCRAGGGGGGGWTLDVVTCEAAAEEEAGQELEVVVVVPPYAGAPEDGDRAPAFSVARAAALARRRRCLLGFFLRQAANGASCWRRGATGSPDVAQAGRIAPLLAGVHPARRSGTDDDGRPNPEQHPAVLRFLRRAGTRSSRSQTDRLAFFSRWRPHAGESAAVEATPDPIIQVKDIYLSRQRQVVRNELQFVHSHPTPP